MLAVRYELFVAYIRKEVWCLLEMNKINAEWHWRKGRWLSCETIYVVHDRSMIVTTTVNTRYRYIDYCTVSIREMSDYYTVYGRKKLYFGAMRLHRHRKYIIRVWKWLKEVKINSNWNVLFGYVSHQMCRKHYYYYRSLIARRRGAVRRGDICSQNGKGKRKYFFSLFLNKSRDSYIEPSMSARSAIVHILHTQIHTYIFLIIILSFPRFSFLSIFTLFPCLILYIFPVFFPYTFLFALLPLECIWSSTVIAISKISIA